jgi:hypothetical protein
MVRDVVGAVTDYMVRMLHGSIACSVAYNQTTEVPVRERATLNHEAASY